MSIHFQSQQDQWTKCISTSGTVRAVAVTLTESAQYLAQRHALSPLGVKALAESMIAGLLLSSYGKSGEKTNLNLKGTGWAQQAIIDANADAEIRGYLIERAPADIQIDASVGPWGIGLLSVLRTKLNESQPYIGTVPLLTGHLAKDITFYWLQSEQVQSAVGIDVQLNSEYQISHAYGFLIQAMPGASDQELQKIESHLKTIHIHEDSFSGSLPLKIITQLLGDQTFSILEEKPIVVKCPCTLERVKKSVLLTGKDEIQSMLIENKNFNITCDFCSENYQLTPQDLKNLLDTFNTTH